MKDAPIKRTSTLFLQAVLVLIGIGTLVFLLWEPTMEGRNVNATVFEIYFKDPFLAYMYVASISFFVALYQAFTLLRHIENNRVFSPDSVKALRTIKYCGMTLAGFIAAAVLYLLTAVRGTDDIAGGVAMGLFITFSSIVIVIATAAAVFEKLLQSAVTMKSENDLTV